MPEYKGTDEQGGGVGRDALIGKAHHEQADGGDAVADERQSPNAQSVSKKRLRRSSYDAEDVEHNRPQDSVQGTLLRSSPNNRAVIDGR